MQILLRQTTVYAIGMSDMFYNSYIIHHKVQFNGNTFGYAMLDKVHMKNCVECSLFFLQ